MFDYIVIGAGSAGCVLAARLSEDERVQVLLMEAGPPDRSREIQIPLAFPRLFQSPVDWNFWTEAQPQLTERHLFWPRGKTLGGSSSINAMVHMDPCAVDFEAWQTPGWSPEEIMPLRGAIHSSGIQPDTVDDINPLSQAFLESCAALGLPLADALTHAATPMAARFRLNIENGRRWGPADAYLRPALNRGNLTVWTNVQARRVVVEPAAEGARVTGVEYSQNDGVHTVAVTREVILCAGTVGSPQLLMLSGVGPRAHLEFLGIPVAAAIEGVGGNLQDHLAAPLSFFSLEPVSYSGALTLANQWQHRVFGKGPLTSNGAEVGAVFRSNPSLAACDLEIVFAAGHYVDHGFASPGGHGFSLLPTLLTPKSRGQIRLASPDPAEPPLIDPAYATNPADIARLSDGILFARKIAEQKPLANYRGAPVQGHIAEPEQHIREWGQTLYHPVGTCKMGIDPDSVVDPHLRVHGVAGLRVADASVMPLIPRAHTNVTTLLIAERAAQLLRV